MTVFIVLLGLWAMFLFGFWLGWDCRGDVEWEREWRRKEEAT